MGSSPLVVGIGGTVRPDSSTERALEVALESAAAAGAEVERFTGSRLAELPLYSPSDPARCEAAVELVEAVRRADGVIIASPGYHASVSGLMKNSLDYLEDLREDTRPYLSRRGVGCIATGAGWQATVATLAAMRAIVHALRGWPTPLGAAINTARSESDGEDRQAAFQLQTVGLEVVEFARLQQQAAAPSTL
ncbi:MAG: reductase [Thermoleophilaceae bacterium]|jgi:FMN reductase|nr:reductase [Thermoleophilaceae bacterium]